MEQETQLTASMQHQPQPVSLACRPMDETSQHHKVQMTCPAEPSPCLNPQDWEPALVFIWATGLSGFVLRD